MHADHLCNNKWLDENQIDEIIFQRSLERLRSFVITGIFHPREI